jgi:hypothetical protein
MIKIEVTGNSIPEVADKLLAIGASLQGTASYATAYADACEIAETYRKTPPKKAEVMPEVVVAPLPIEDEPLEVIDLPAADTPTIDFNADIRAPALKVVEKCGKPALEAILAHFGVARASLVAPERLPELLAKLNEALG